MNTNRLCCMCGAQFSKILKVKNRRLKNSKCKLFLKGWCEACEEYNVLCPSCNAVFMQACQMHSHFNYNHSNQNYDHEIDSYGAEAAQYLTTRQQRNYVNEHLSNDAEVEIFDGMCSEEEEACGIVSIRKNTSGPIKICCPLMASAVAQQLSPAKQKSPLMRIPLPIRDTPVPFGTFSQLQFAVKEYIMNKHRVSKSFMTTLISRLHTHYLKDGYLDIPSSMSQIENFELILPVMKTKARKDNSALFSIKDIIVNVLANKELCSFIRFENDVMSSNGDNNLVLDEVYKSPGYTIYDSHVANDEIKLILMLYYDDFKEYNLACSSCGALNLTFMNMRRKTISKPDNIFLVALVDKKEEYDGIIKEVVQELVDLYKPHRVYCSAVQGYITVRTFLGLFTADTVQRNKTCHQKSVQSRRPCVHCLVIAEDLHKNLKSFDNERGIELEERSVPLARSHHNRFLNCTDSMERISICKRYGIKPQGGKRNYEENSFWQLHNLYSFDIQKQIVPDLFHLLLIGLFPLHINLIHDMLSAKERRRLRELVSHYTTLGVKVRDYDTKNSWYGDEWLLFLSIAPFVYEKVLTGSDVLCKHYKCLLLHCVWARELLQPGLTVQEINSAELKCHRWRNEMVKLFGFNVLNIPNFHKYSTCLSICKAMGCSSIVLDKDV